MIIEYVYLENFISHRRTEIRFSNGLNIIIGKNGSGKSSIFEGIKFAFFGLEGKDRDKYISYNKNHAIVKVRFSHSSALYEIERHLELSGESERQKKVELLVNGKKVAEGAKEVNDYILNAFSISRDAFLNSVFVEQGDIENLINLAPKNRKETIDGIIGIEGYSKASEILWKLSREEKGKTEIKNNVVNDLVKIKKDLDEKVEKLNNSRENEKILFKKAIEIEKDLKNLKELNQKRIKKKERLDNLNQQKNELERNLNDKKNKLNDIKKQIENLYDIKTEYESLSKNPLVQNYLDISNLSSTVSSLKMKSQEMEKLLLKIERKNELKSKLNQINFNENDIQSCENKILELSKNISMAENRMKECLEVNKNIHKFREDLHNERKNKTKIIEKIFELIHKKIEDPEEISNEISLIESNRNKLSEEIEKLSLQTKNISKQEKETMEKLRMLGEDNTCPLCGQELSETHRIELEERMNKDIADFKNIINENNEKLKKMNRDIENLNDLIKSLKGSNYTRLFEINEKIRKLEEDLKKNEEKLESPEKISSEIENYKIQLKEENERKKELRKIQTQRDEIKAELIALERENLESNLNSCQSEIKEMEGKINSFRDETGIMVTEKVIESSSKLIKELKKLENDMKNYEKYSEEEKNTVNELNEIQDKLSGILNEMKNVEQELEKFQGVDTNLELKENEYRDVKGKIQSAKDMAEELEKDIEKLKIDIEEKEIILNDIERIEKFVSAMEEVQRAISPDGIPASLRIYALNTINMYCRKIMLSFNMGFEDISISKNFEIKVLQNGIQKVIKQLSGGERTAVAITVRLAIARYLNTEMNSVLMDEPTVYLDEERRNDLKDILENGMYDIGNLASLSQIIIITHHRELELRAAVVFHIDKNDQGISIVETE
ncbi:AAA family ATPase [Caldiplasma sukawensis]